MHRVFRLVLYVTALAALAFAKPADACTNVLITRGATVDGASMITYAADSHELYGYLQQSAAGIHPEGTMIDVIEWDTGKLIGKMKQATRTYSVVGNMNEFQLAIAETTFGGRSENVDPKGGIDYGSIIYVTLQRARTAREAVLTMAKLAEEYGYRSEGETFSISDPKEVWIMEMVGKGPGKKGAVWVARRIPDGMISAHANQSRIHQFPLNEPENTLYAKDVITLARERGFYSGKDADFSFADTYAPGDPQSLRTCEARVWRVFDKFAPSAKLTSDFVHGKAGAQPPPLWIKPDRKLGVLDAMTIMRDHFEGTEFDLSKGIGAGPFALPYRWRPLFWKVGESTYLNERAISTQQTGFVFVTQSRGWLPNSIGGLQWFGVDDAASTVFVPIYSSIRKVPPAFAVGAGSLQRFSWDSAFWVFNWVANFAYSRYSDMIQDIGAVQRELEGGFLDRQASVEQAALRLHAQSPEQAREYLTTYSLRQADETVRRWRKLGEDLLVKYMDGNVKEPTGGVLHPPYPADWYKRIVAESGDHFKVATPPKKPGSEPWVIESRTNLGPLSSIIPADFPFDREKLVLLPGSAQCGQLPRCCVTPVADGEKLIAYPPTTPKRATELPATCGEPGWLARVPKGEKRPVELAKPASH